jgi:Icc protein
MNPFDEQRRSWLKGALVTLTGLSTLGLPGRLLAQAVKPSSPQDRLRFRFAVASDGHYGQPETPYRAYHEHLIEWLIQEKASRGLDLVVFNGDLIHDNASLLSEVKSYYQRLGIPYYVTRGNHDRVSETAWRNTWGYAFNHDVERAQYAFVLGNTSNEAGEYLCADLDWLEQRLHFHAKKKHIFVFLHIPQQSWTKNGVPCIDALKVLEKHANVSAVFHGHEHDQDGLKEAYGKKFFFDGHFGGNWGTAYKGYRIVEIARDHSLHTYQYNPEINPIVNATSL